jgi:HEAT repeat protein
MTISVQWLAQRVAANWSLAVAEAAHLFPESRDALYEALHVADPEVRAAAVAALNEANDSHAHDRVAQLLMDPNESVRSEALEYIEQFPQLTDAPVLLDGLLDQEACFMSSLALARLTGESGPTVAPDSELSDRQSAAARWREIIETKSQGKSSDA